MKNEEKFAAAMAQAEALLREAMDHKPLAHPMTGAKVADANIERTIPTRLVRRLQPMPPERREVTEWDDDGPAAWRELSEAEYAERVAGYEANLAEWKRTNGVVRVLDGPVEIRGHFTLADGSRGVAELGGGEWRWVSLEGLRDE